MTIAMFLFVVSLSLWAALYFYPRIIRKRLDHIKIEWQKGNVTLSKMRKLLKRFPPKYWITSKAEIV